MDIQTAYDCSIDLLNRMIAIPSTSRNEEAVADMLQAYMQQVSGLDVHRHHNNLWLVDPRFCADRPTLLLNAHIDTVRPAASWQHDPFRPTLEDVPLPDGTLQSRLYGLGSNDDGASLVTLLHIFLLLISERNNAVSEPSDPNSSISNGSAVEPNLIFIASAEEEVSGANGIDSLINHDGPLSWLNHSSKPVVALVGEPTGMQPAVAEKGLVVLDGVAQGRSGHAARNEGINALYLALDAVDKLRRYQFERTSANLGPIKVTVTGIQCGTTHNVIPDRCSFMVDCRTTDAYTNEEVVAQLQTAIDAKSLPEGTLLPKFGTEPTAQSPSALNSPLATEEGRVFLQPRSTRLQPSGISPDHPLLRRIVALGRQPFGSPTLSDQALMRFPSLKMGPGQSSRSHTADEYICPDEIREALQIYYDVLHNITL